MRHADDDEDLLIIEEEADENERGFFGPLIIGVALGAGLMYFLGPNREARRRELAVNRAQKALRNRARRVPGAIGDPRSAVFEPEVRRDATIAHMELGGGYATEV